MPLPTNIVPRIGALIRLLASDQDNEALGAARGLIRTLNGAGLDLSDLADALAPSRKPRAPRAPRAQRAPQARQEQSAGVLRWSLDCRFTVARTLRQGIAADVLDKWEAGFATDIIGMITTSGRPRDLTPKQAKRINKLLAKIAESAQ